MEKAHKAASKTLLREVREERERQLAQLLSTRQHLMEAESVRSEQKMKAWKKPVRKAGKGQVGILKSAAYHARSMKQNRNNKVSHVYGPSA